MPAYQIQVQGLLDGATPFVIPDPIPDPELGGVIKIDAGAGIDVGTFDISALTGTNLPTWIRTCQVEYSDPTRASRIELILNGSLVNDRIIPDYAQIAAGPLMPPFALSTGVVAPVGAVLRVLTDNSGALFQGTPTTGPHFVYIDLEPIRNDEQLGLIQDLEAFANLKSLAQGQVINSFQAVAATFTEFVANVRPPIVGDQARMQVQSVQVTVGAAPAAGESMTIQVRRVRNGTAQTPAIAGITLDSTTPANSVTQMVLDPVRNDLLANDLLEVVRLYVPGGGATPMTNTLVRIQLVPLAL